MKKIVSILIPILICFLVGFVASRFQADAIENWYPYLNKSALNPPNIAFPIAWNIIYVLIGLSIGLIVASDNEKKKYFINIFLLQLFLNFMWSISFFYFQSPLLGFINILLLDWFVIYYIVRTFNTATVSSLLFLPYLAWICFATYLNFYILMNN